MVFKYDISVSGINFYPEKIIDKIKGDFVLEYHFKPTDKLPINDIEEYGYGAISFWHPNKFSTEENIVEFESAIIKFLELNLKTFNENGADEFQIFIEIYFDGGQCNFEIFNRELLKRLANIGVSIPISVYVIDEIKLNHWEQEIKLNWAGNQGQ
jgi:hypothetical protein